jgi:voltage-gated potassium channel
MLKKKIQLLNFDNQNFKKEELKNKPLKHKIHSVIFEADTFAGKLFDVVLLIMIILSVLILMLDTVPTYHVKYHDIFYVFEWIITVFFTIEYFLRLYSVYNPIRYAKSFFGIIDVLSTCPMYLSLFIPGVNSLMIVRILRLLRVFRIFKLENYLNQANIIIVAMKDSLRKISIFLFFIVLIVTIFGSILYVIEHNENEGFDSIPTSIYWAIVTITTVGYGDISPITPLGKMMASIIMIVGYAVIAVPTGIVTSSFITNSRKNPTKACKNCTTESHVIDAQYCYHCGFSLTDSSE